MTPISAPEKESTSSPETLSFAPIPSSFRERPRKLHDIKPLVASDDATAKLIAQLLNKAGLSIGEAARQMGVTPNAIRQYVKGRRNKPSVAWLVRLAELCGATVYIEFPDAS